MIFFKGIKTMKVAYNPEQNNWYLFSNKQYKIYSNLLLKSPRIKKENGIITITGEVVKDLAKAFKTYFYGQKLKYIKESEVKAGSYIYLDEKGDMYLV